MKFFWNISRSVALLGLLAAAGAAGAEETYPSKAITIVVPYTAGGVTDMLARMVAEVLGKEGGQSVIVENKPGAGGAIAGSYVARSKADGYTLFMTSSGINAITPVLYKEFKTESLAQISVLVDVPFALSVRPDFQARTLKDFIAYGKQHPGAIRIGTASLGSHGHLTEILFSKETGVQLSAVPYKGSVPALNDLMGGHIDAMIDNVGVQKPFIAAGKIAPLFVTSASRSPALPDVPTATELGVTFRSVAWFGLAAPRNTPAPVIEAIQHMIAAGVAKDPALRDRLVDLGLTPVFSTPQEAAARTAEEMKTLGGLAATLDLGTH